MNAVTGLIPQLPLVTKAGGVASKAAVIIGKASVWVEMVHSVSGDRPGVAVDQRAGQVARSGR